MPCYLATRRARCGLDPARGHLLPYRGSVAPPGAPAPHATPCRAARIVNYLGTRCGPHTGSGGPKGGCWLSRGRGAQGRLQVTSAVLQRIRRHDPSRSLDAPARGSRPVLSVHTWRVVGFTLRSSYPTLTDLDTGAERRLFVHARYRIPPFSTVTIGAKRSALLLRTRYVPGSDLGLEIVVVITLGRCCDSRS